MADKAISLDQFKEALKAIRNSTISEPDLSVKFVENAPDFNAVEGQAGYIKNRPFGFKRVEVLPETTIELFDSGEGFMYSEVQFQFPLDVNFPATVTYDGETYECTPFGEGEEVALGNMILIGGEDTGEPFFMIPVGGGDLIYMIACFDGRTAGTTLSLKIESTSFVKLPCEYVTEEKIPSFVFERNGTVKTVKDTETLEWPMRYVYVQEGEDGFSSSRELEKYLSSGKDIEFTWLNISLSKYVDPISGEETANYIEIFAPNITTVKTLRARFVKKTIDVYVNKYLYSADFGGKGKVFFEFAFDYSNEANNKISARAFSYN